MNLIKNKLKNQREDNHMKIFKKSQIQSQIFIYVFAVIVVSLILIFGVKAIFSVKKDTDNIAIVNFQTDLKTIVASVASEYGSIQKAELILPKEFKQVCFTDSLTNSVNIPSGYPLIKNALESGVLDNIHVIKSANDINEFKTQTNLSVNYNNHFFCVNNTQGRIIFTIKGLSRYAEISP